MNSENVVRMWIFEIFILEALFFFVNNDVLFLDEPKTNISENYLKIKK